MTDQSLFGQQYGGSYGTTHPSSSSPPSSDYGEPLIPGVKKNNFPPCFPRMYHDIATEIHPDQKIFVRRAYFGWYFHCFGLLWNLVCLLGATSQKVSNVGNVFMGIIALVLGIPISFYVYWTLYKAVRSNSSSKFVIWFGIFGCMIIYEAFCALGISMTGGAGFLLMISAFTSNQVTIGIMLAVATFFWIGVIIYNVSLFNSGRIIYRGLGGHKAATKEFSQVAVTSAYNNRDNIKSFAVEHKDTIKQIVEDNKDTIVDFARDHREEIAEVVVDNRQTIYRVAADNKDTIWENREIVSGVFGDAQHGNPHGGANTAV